jgi:hypothetical protein
VTRNGDSEAWHAHVITVSRRWCSCHGGFKLPGLFECNSKAPSDAAGPATRRVWQLQADLGAAEMRTCGLTERSAPPLARQGCREEEVPFRHTTVAPRVTHSPSRTAGIRVGLAETRRRRPTGLRDPMARCRHASGSRHGLPAAALSSRVRPPPARRWRLPAEPDPQGLSSSIPAVGPTRSQFELKGIGQSLSLCGSPDSVRSRCRWHPAVAP